MHKAYGIILQLHFEKLDLQNKNNEWILKGIDAR